MGTGVADQAPGYARPLPDLSGLKATFKGLDLSLPERAGFAAAMGAMEADSDRMKMPEGALGGLASEADRWRERQEANTRTLRKYLARIPTERSLTDRQIMRRNRRYGDKASYPFADVAAGVRLFRMLIGRPQDRERIARNNARLARARVLQARQARKAACRLITLRRHENERPPPRLPDVAALVYAPHGPDAHGVPVAA